MKTKQDQLIDALNNLWDLLEPVKYNDFNQVIQGSVLLQYFEKDNPKVGRKGLTVTTLSLIATITDYLIDKRLAAVVDDNGFITGWSWYKNEN